MREILNEEVVLPPPLVAAEVIGEGIVFLRPAAETLKDILQHIVASTGLILVEVLVGVVQFPLKV
jgi:hypothetical protein